MVFIFFRGCLKKIKELKGLLRLQALLFGIILKGIIRMLEKKEKLKMEFEYLKGIQNLFIVAIFGIIAYVFTNIEKISFIIYVICFFALAILIYICFKMFLRIQKIIKDEKCKL